MKQKYAAVLLVFSLFIGCGCISAAAAPEKDAKSRMEDMKERYIEIEKRFDSLTDEQKAQVYELNAMVLSQMEELIQEYAELGVLTEEEANQIINHINDRSSKAQENGNVVGIPCPH